MDGVVNARHGARSARNDAMRSTNQTPRANTTRKKETEVTRSTKKQACLPNKK